MKEKRNTIQDNKKHKGAAMRKKWFQLLGTIIIAVSLTGCGNILTESSFDSEKEEDDFYTVNMVSIGK